MAGRPFFAPTPQQRAEVRTMAGYGTPQVAIARRLGIAPNTLTRHFREELLGGEDEANMAVAQSAWQQATGRRVVADPTQPGGLRTERCDPVPSVTMFWLRTRMGWREPPTQVEHDVSLNVANATDEEIARELATIRRKRAAARDGGVEAGLPEESAQILH